MPRSVVVAFGDLHCGHNLGIAAPGTLLKKYDEEGNFEWREHELTPPQKYLYDLFQRGKKEIKKFAGKDPVHVFFGGDPTNGNKFYSENFTNAQESQVAVALDVIDSFVKEKWVKTVRLASSSAVHAFSPSNADSQLEVALRERNKDKDIKLVRHGKSSIGGGIVDFAHHGPRGESIRDWLDGRQMRYYLDDLFYKNIRNRSKVPALVLRHHVHTRTEEWLVKFRVDERIKMVGLTVPSFQLLSGFAEKVTKSEEWVTNGMVAVEMIDGIPTQVEWFAESRDISAKEVL